MAQNLKEEYMRYQFYREHKYVSAALNDVERLIARTDFCDSEAVHQVAEAFEALSQMLQGHAHYENERLHPLLEKKGSKVHIHATDDHALQHNQLLEIQDLITKISQSSEEKIELGYQLYLAYRKFVADNLIHLHEEETQILPELQRLYSDEELRQIESPTYREMTPEQIIQMTEVLFPHMNRIDQEAILADIRLLEPEKFKTVHERIGQ
jgi:hemerythrin-like domain-containing protein